VAAERQILVFYVSGHQYALDILDLQEVGRLPPVVPEPGLPDGVVGVVQVHDKPVRVRDLGYLLRGVVPDATENTEPAGPVSEAERPWVIVSRSGADGQAREHYWRVDAVSDIVPYDPARVVYPDGDAERPGILDLGGTLTYMLRPGLLAERT